MASIFTLKGMTLAISKFTLSIADDGSVSSHMTLKLRYDACLAWVGITLYQVALLAAQLRPGHGWLARERHG